MSTNRSFMAGTALKVLAHAQEKTVINLSFLNQDPAVDATLTVRRILAENVGVNSVDITTAGTDYITIPSVVFDAPTSGTTALGTAIIGITSITSYDTAGTGYVVSDVVTLGSGGTLTVTSIDGSGGITGADITTPGTYSAYPAQPIAITGGTGAGGEISVKFKLIDVSMTEKGNGYKASIPNVVIDGVATGTVVMGGTYEDYQRIENSTVLVSKLGSLELTAIVLEIGDLIGVMSNKETISCNSYGIAAQ
ncbi:MAG: hypothetical protein COA63_014080 [Methylophaga sp.]|nr:hypothetical protein [Methylophaga sp.]